MGRAGFEPTKPKQLSYSQSHLTALESPQDLLLSLQRDSNPRPRDYKSRALANWAMEAKYLFFFRSSSLSGCFPIAFAKVILFCELPNFSRKKIKFHFIFFLLEPTMRFELTTSSLPRKRSTPELRRLTKKSPRNEVILERKTGVEPATFSLEGWRSTNWATSAF